MHHSIILHKADRTKLQ